MYTQGCHEIDRSDHRQRPMTSQQSDQMLRDMCVDMCRSSNHAYAAITVSPSMWFIHVQLNIINLIEKAKTT